MVFEVRLEKDEFREIAENKHYVAILEKATGYKIGDVLVLNEVNEDERYTGYFALAEIEELSTDLRYRPDEWIAAVLKPYNGEKKFKLEGDERN